jgi:hypothetical protein
MHTSIKLFLLLLLGIPLYYCNNPSMKNNNTTCREPSITCKSDTCRFVHIFDKKGNFVVAHTLDAMSNSTFSFAWDGKDCNGSQVPCGKYISKIYLSASGKTDTFSQNIFVRGQNSEYATGRAACNSLHASCTGTYEELNSYTIDTNGVSIPDSIGCICCQ